MKWNMPGVEGGGSVHLLSALATVIPRPSATLSRIFSSSFSCFSLADSLRADKRGRRCQRDTKAARHAEPPAAAQPTFSLLFEMLVLIQEADFGLRAQRDVVLISSGLTAAVLLLLFRGALASSLQQLLELRFHQCPSEPSPTQSGASCPGACVRILAFGRVSCARRRRAAPLLR